jgi:hypothetical protein
MVESFIVSAVYLALAVVTWFAFFHHPVHVGIKIGKKGQNFNYSLNVDTTNTTTDAPKVDIPEDIQGSEIDLGSIVQIANEGVTLVDAF